MGLLTSTKLGTSSGAASSSTAEVIESSALRDLIDNGEPWAIKVREVTANHGTTKLNFFYTRRIWAIAEDLGVRFGLPKGHHTKPHEYQGVDGIRSIVTGDLFNWLEYHGVSLKASTVNNHRTIWNRASAVKRNIQKALRNTDPQAPEFDQLREVEELMDILEVGIDIDEVTPTYNHAKDIWKMKQKEWDDLMKTFGTANEQ